MHEAMTERLGVMPTIVAELAGRTTAGERTAFACVAALGAFALLIAVAKWIDLSVLAGRERRFAAEARLSIGSDELGDAALRHRRALGAQVVSALSIALLPPGAPRRDESLRAAGRVAAVAAHHRIGRWLGALSAVVLVLPLAGALVAASSLALTLAVPAPHRAVVPLVAGDLVPLVVGLAFALPAIVAERLLDRRAARMAAALDANLDDWLERTLLVSIPAAGPVGRRRRPSDRPIFARHRRALRDVETADPKGAPDADER